MINIGGNIGELYVGSTKIAEAYVGNQLVYRSAPEVLPYDAEIEYLETQGNCYIQTTCVPSGSNIAISTKFTYLGYTTNSSYIPWYRTYVNEQTQCFRMMRNRASTTSVLITNGAISSGSASDYNLTITSGGTYVIETNGRSVTVNGTTKNARVPSTVLNTNVMTIFHNVFKGRCYYFRIKDAGTLILDCIPVRVGTEGYLYDKVSKQLFGNAGTGTLILGNDV